MCADVTMLLKSLGLLNISKHNFHFFYRAAREVKIFYAINWKKNNGKIIMKNNQSACPAKHPVGNWAILKLILAFFLIPCEAAEISLLGADQLIFRVGGYGGFFVIVCHAKRGKR